MSDDDDGHAQADSSSSALGWPEGRWPEVGLKQGPPLRLRLRLFPPPTPTSFWGLFLALFSVFGSIGRLPEDPPRASRLLELTDSGSEPVDPRRVLLLTNRFSRDDIGRHGPNSRPLVAGRRSRTISPGPCLEKNRIA
ncbi:hypothetical protein BO79DRAFT_224543 [Aspergillus costaricaensis CBS 115574]|uniref:Uncharacterized protein n=1 Tax=Aspergillus costaricaensis CBS 115574 TaxID=1448317 RepID=A0ACD1IQY6_9EURO|nr:hypothetical protein BO79DRAFT_224543 [Aspergillus costaricaensis CBS 115574]RAK93018.1 hypothetical protein BO79DRAFT_224543 [Aspergillus costaricaensis CBS 115574]